MGHGCMSSTETQYSGFWWIHLEDESRRLMLAVMGGRMQRKWWEIYCKSARGRMNSCGCVKPIFLIVLVASTPEWLKNGGILKQSLKPSIHHQTQGFGMGQALPLRFFLCRFFERKGFLIRVFCSLFLCSVHSSKNKRKLFFGILWKHLIFWKFLEEFPINNF